MLCRTDCVIFLCVVLFQGCRDLLRLLLEKSQSVPAVGNVCTMMAIDAVYNVRTLSLICSLFLSLF